MGSPSPSEPERKRVRFSSNGNPATTEDEKPEKTTLQATDVVQLRFIHDASQIDSAGAAGPHPPSLTVHPPFLHQIFPNSVLHGWRSLTVAVYVHFPSLTYWIDSAGEEVDHGIDDDATSVTDAPALLAPFVKGGLVASREEFEKVIEDAAAPRLTNRVAEYDKEERKFAIYKQSFFDRAEDGTMVKDDAFHDFHLRMSFLMFVYIDGASFIDDEDPRWEVFVTMEEMEGKSQCFVGYATIYQFSVLTKHGGGGMMFCDRIRISQVIISPLEQGRGHGSKLLHVIYKNAQSRNAMEVTVEDPSSGFRILRDVTDLKRAYSKNLLQPDFAMADKDEEETVSKLRKDLLLTAGQAKRCLEAHQLRFVDRQDEAQYKKYRLWVKRRLFKDNYEVLHTYDKEERKQKLSDIYEDFEKEYLTAIVRLQGKH